MRVCKGEGEGIIVDFADMSLPYQTAEMAREHDYRYSTQLLAGEHSRDLEIGYPLPQILLRLAAAECASGRAVWCYIR